MISAIANGPKTVALYPENTAEIKTLRIGPWIKDRILLVDLGFYKTQLFARGEEWGIFCFQNKDEYGYIHVDRKWNWKKSVTSS